MKFTILSILMVAAVASARVHSKATHEGLVAAVATGTQQQNFGSALEAFMLAFQRIMPCGSAKLGIPALAPFKMPFYSLQHETQYLKLNGNFSNIVIGGANSFQVLAGSYDTTTNHLTYDFIYPEMQVLAENALDIWALVAGYPMQLSAQGLINIRITDFRIVGSFDVIQNPANPKGLQVANFNMRFYIGDIVFNNWNNLWNIAGNNFANKMAREAVLEWAEQIQGDVDAIYDALVLPMVNDALADVNMTQVVDWFMQEAQIFDSVPCTLSGNTL